jgi:UDP-GlcNAc:undecaprenyl-phosphate GlcNAc-1-phosphate transferase
LAIAAVTTAACNRPARTVALKVGHTAQPDVRKVHQRVTPYGGGAAMFVGLCVAACLAVIFPALRTVITSSHEMLGVLIGAGIIFAVGMIDDQREMSAPAKVAGEVLAASALYFAGATMYQLKLPFAGFIVLGPAILPLVTATWVFALCNAVNLIDGLDGLAGGIVAIASGTLCVYGLRLEDLGLLPRTNIGPLVAAITCGICLGFLPDNFHPARVFMGDSGALMLGFLMAAATMVIGGRTPPTSGVTFFFFAPLFIPFFILGVPIFDAVLAFVRRTAGGQGFHNADKNHIHHRLMRLGHGHRRTVAILWLWTALLCGFVLFPLFLPRVNVFIPFGVALLAIALFTWFHPSLRPLPAERPEASEEPNETTERQVR